MIFSKSRFAENVGIPQPANTHNPKQRCAIDLKEAMLILFSVTEWMNMVVFSFYYSSFNARNEQFVRNPLILDKAIETMHFLV